jgi:tRNA pseudouridine38-40 synthase
MERYKVILAYDGTEFLGFQRQANGRTVQGEVEAALTRIGWTGASITAAGRTDAGVHADGQVIAFDHAWNHSLEALQNALNANLPTAVAVRTIEAAPADFHPRFDARVRRYRYRILVDPQRAPLRERYSWRVWPRLDMAILQQCADQFVGSHDFAAFGRPPRAGGETVRRVFETRWQAAGDELYFEIAANAFLYHMVRRIVQAQVDIAKTAGSAALIEDFLAGAAGEVQGLAPACGLSLIEVKYREPDGARRNIED